jgi:hypothetical protein
MTQSQETEHNKLVDYMHALELALNEIVQDQSYATQQYQQGKHTAMMIEEQYEKLQRKMKVILHAWQEVVGVPLVAESTVSAVESKHHKHHHKDYHHHKNYHKNHLYNHL